MTASVGISRLHPNSEFLSGVISLYKDRGPALVWRTA